MMHAGKLNHDIEIQRPGTKTPDGGGGFTQPWVSLPVDTLDWAWIQPVAGLRRVRGMKAHADATHVVTLRYREDLDSTMRFKHQGRIFRLLGPPISPDDSGRWMTFSVREEKNG